jgi:two-component system phosphate regulon sensor histidine kinase PhoR
MGKSERGGLNSNSYAKALRKLTLRYEKLLKELSLLHQIDALKSCEVDTEDLCRSLLQALTSEMPVENCSLMLVDDSGEYLELRAVSSPLEENAQKFSPGQWPGKKFRIGEGVVGKAAQCRELIHVPDVHMEEGFVSLQESPVRIRSLVCLPLYAEDELIGVLNVSHPSANYFETETVRTFQLIADRIAKMLMAHRLFRKLHASECLFCLVAEKAGDGILVFDTDGRILNANHAIEKISGFTADQLVNNEVRWIDHVMEEDRPVYTKWIQKTMSASNGELFSYRYVDRHSKVHYLEQLNSPLTDIGGEQIGVVAVIRDITERREAEARLQESEERYRLLAESASDIIVVHDLSGQILYVNEATITTSGYPKERIIGANLTDFMPAERVQEEKVRLEKWKEGYREPLIYESEYISRSGQKIPVEVNSSLLVRDGRPSAVLLVVRDIRERRKAEEELQRLEKLRRDYLANVSHQFKTPLTIIQGYAETLLNSDLKKPHLIRDFLATIHDNAGRLSQMTEDLLKMSEMDEGGLRLHFEEVSLREIVDECLVMLRPMADQLGIQIQNTLPRELPIVEADPLRLKEIVQNLLDNAIQYSHPGGTVSIHTEREPGHLRLSIRDTGIGISQEDKARVFDRFYRTEDGRSKKAGGTGLGLAIVKHLVDAHRGRIEVESTPNQGSTFTVSLPIRKPAGNRKGQPHKLTSSRPYRTES